MQKNNGEGAYGDGDEGDSKRIADKGQDGLASATDHMSRT